MQRFYDQSGEFVTIEKLLDWVRAHPLGDGRIVPIIIWGGFGVGKALAADTPVLTRSGWRPIGSLRIDDELIDPTGGITRVSGVFPQGSRKLYRIRFADGAYTDCDIEHLWKVQIDSQPWQVVSLRELLDQVNLQRQQITIPAVSPQAIAEFDLDVRIPGPRQIVDVNQIETGAAVCIAVDSPAQLYIAENFIVTHNTQQIKAYGRHRNIEVRTYAPAHDVNGADIVGKAYRDPETNETRYALPEWLPTEDDAPEGVLFIDELNRAPQEVLAGLMEPLGEGTIAQSNWVLPRGWNIIAAANPSEMGYMVQDLDEAMVDRLVHYAPGWDARLWGQWAASANIDPAIVDFALRNQGSRGRHGLVVTGEHQLPTEIEGKLRTTPRTLEYMSALYEPGMPEGMLRVCAEGLMGREGAEAFISQIAEDERPLQAEVVLAEPGRDDNGRAIYPYDAAIDRWNQDNLIGDQLLRATAERLIIYLLGIEPVSDDPKKNRIAQLAGRFLARLPEGHRDSAFEALGRSALSWLGVVQAATLTWQTALARQHRLLGTTGSGERGGTVQAAVDPGGYTQTDEHQLPAQGGADELDPSRRGLPPAP